MCASCKFNLRILLGQHKRQGQTSGIHDLIFQKNWERLFAGRISYGKRFQIFGASYLKDFKP